MPAFTFEKLSPPVRRGPLPPGANQQPKKARGLVGLLMNRFVERRLRKNLGEERGGAARDETSD